LAGQRPLAELSYSIGINKLVNTKVPDLGHALNLRRILMKPYETLKNGIRIFKFLFLGYIIYVTLPAIPYGFRSQFGHLRRTSSRLLVSFQEMIDDDAFHEILSYIHGTKQPDAPNESSSI
jgi:hypothetical protein